MAPMSEIPAVAWAIQWVIRSGNARVDVGA